MVWGYIRVFGKIVGRLPLTMVSAPYDRGHTMFVADSDHSMSKIHKGGGKRYPGLNLRYKVPTVIERGKPPHILIAAEAGGHSHQSRYAPRLRAEAAHR